MVLEFWAGICIHSRWVVVVKIELALYSLSLDSFTFNSNLPDYTLFLSKLLTYPSYLYYLLTSKYSANNKNSNLTCDLHRLNKDLSLINFVLEWTLEC